MEQVAWTMSGLFAATLFRMLFYLGNKIDGLRDKMDDRFGSVNQRFDSTDSRIDALAARLDARIDALAGLL